MSSQQTDHRQAPVPSVERVTTPLVESDLNDLCDATDAAVIGGGGFGWLSPPPREVLERYWQGVVTMPARTLLLGRLDGAVAGAVQLVKPPANNEAQRFAIQLTGMFVAPWARGHGLARALVLRAEEVARADGYGVINLDVRETQTAAITLYEDLGYLKVGDHPYYACVDNVLIPGRYYTKVIDPHLIRLK